MLIPSIDLMGGKIVQQAHGERKSLEFEDFEPWLQKFEKFPVVHVVDLDAALGQGSNRDVVNRISRRLRCQVGGGIKTPQDAEVVLAAGAKRVVIGSALFEGDKVNTDIAKEFDSVIGNDKLVAAVDARAGRIAIRGWKTTISLSADDAMKELEPYVNAFVYTHIDTEGMMSGFPLPTARTLRECTKHQLMLAGGIRNMDDVAQLDLLGADAIVGMAIYSGAMQL